MLLALLLPTSVFAQTESQKTKKQIEPSDFQNTEAPFLLDATLYEMNFVHKPDAKLNEATLRITQPLSINGCAKIHPLETQTKVQGRNIEITVSAPIVTLDNKGHYTQHGCKQNMNAVTADVTLNRDQLITDEINKVVFKGPGGKDRYDIYVDHNKLSLFTKLKDSLTRKEIKIKGVADKVSFIPSKITQRKDPLTYWFYPDNLVLVYAASPPAGKDISSKIAMLARRNGLVEAEKLIPGFSSPLTDQNILYFIDQAGNLGDKLRSGVPAQLGDITINETFRGSQGPYNKEKKLAIFARPPGLLD
ncbi:MAG: hypothetical protein DHS20C02_09770 [Micavibrio sp.]|nr:MAG: hypothetical protein DHS20C02_09770 [Micavibrio sp.]